MAENAGILAGLRGLILGVSSENSVGFHCARAAREQGARIAVTHRPVHRERGLAAAGRLEGALALPFDACDEDAASALLARIAEHWGGLDFVVHTLASAPPGGVLSRPLVDADHAAFDAVLRVGVHSLIDVCHHALPLLRRSASPRVVTLTSAGADLAYPGYHLIGISKGALAAAVRYLAAELGPYGVLCNALSFPLVATSGAERALGTETISGTLRRLDRRALTGTTVTLEEIADTLAVMCSPLLSNMTGQTLVLDAGISLTDAPLPVPDRETAAERGR